MGGAALRRILDGASLVDIPEFPEWKLINYYRWTSIDGILVTVRMQLRGDQAVFEAIKAIDDTSGEVVFTETLPIDDENLDNIQKEWRLFQHMLPSLMMEHLL